MPSLEEVSVPAITSKPKALTAENLEAHSRASVKAPSVASKKGKKGPQKPAWAQTEN